MTFFCVAKETRSHSSRTKLTQKKYCQTIQKHCAKGAKEVELEVGDNLSVTFLTNSLSISRQNDDLQMYFECLDVLHCTCLEQMEIDINLWFALLVIIDLTFVEHFVIFRFTQIFNSSCHSICMVRIKLKLKILYFLVRNIAEQVCMVKTVIFSFRNHRVLSSSLINSIIHICTRFYCCGQQNF